MTRALQIVALALLLSPSVAKAQAPVEVEPADLAKRKDLIGREVLVDDRVKYFFPVAGKGYPEIILARTDVLVVLPDRLAYTTSQSARSIKVRGILRRKADGSGLYIDATQAPELFRSDVDRIKAAIATMAPDDLAAHVAWGEWATRRAKAFDDDDLKPFADRLQAEAIALEYRSPKARTPETLMALARKARAKGVAEPEPSAIAHMAFNIRLGSARTLEEFQRLADDVRGFLPDSKTPAKAGVKFPNDAYAKDPHTAYFESGADIRRALDRKLWTDAVSQIYRLRAATDPAKWKALGEEAKQQIPDHPEVGGDLISRYYKHVSKNVTTLRKSEMHDFVRTIRVDLNQPEEALALNRTWLEAKRKELGANDSELRVDLAGDYLADLNDRAAAAELALESLKIDPSNSLATVFLQRMGFVKSGESWRDSKDPAAKPTAPVADAPRPVGKDDPILGLTPTEVKAQLGDPKRTSRVATQGRVCMQWVYESGRGSQVIDFVQSAGDPQPIVTGRFSVR